MYLCQHILNFTGAQSELPLGIRKCHMAHIGQACFGHAYLCLFQNFAGDNLAGVEVRPVLGSKDKDMITTLKCPKSPRSLYGMFRSKNFICAFVWQECCALVPNWTYSSQSRSVVRHCESKPSRECVLRAGWDESVADGSFSFRKAAMVGPTEVRKQLAVHIRHYIHRMRACEQSEVTLRRLLFQYASVVFEESFSNRESTSKVKQRASPFLVHSVLQKSFCQESDSKLAESVECHLSFHQRNVIVFSSGTISLSLYIYIYIEQSGESCCLGSYI